MDNREQRLSEIARHLDISPSDFKLAQERYTALKNWLLEGRYDSGSCPDIYLQGSFRLGTVVKPYRGDRDGEFDIDQVIELTEPAPSRAPDRLKQDIGNHLKSHADYLRMLDDEGRRCWTLEYASAEGRPGFHLDILPALPSPERSNQKIDITDRQGHRYSWLVSNPKDYYQWFKSKNPFSDRFIAEQKQAIYQQNRSVFTDHLNVPTQLLRSPLQRAIQLMKRHRDVYFASRDYRPISIIITTLSAHTHGAQSIAETMLAFSHYVSQRHHALVRDGYLATDGILDYNQGLWLIPNPTLLDGSGGATENFADKWNHDAGYAVAFFEWAKQLARDVRGFAESGLSDDLQLKVQGFGEGRSYPLRLKHAVRHDPEGSNGGCSQYLHLIHLAIEGRVEWSAVEAIAQQVFDHGQGEASREVAKVNFYQVARHQGKTLSDAAVADIRQLLDNNRNSPAFVMCCHLLLGTATQEMVQRCVADYQSEDVLQWPIIKLANPRILGF